MALKDMKLTKAESKAEDCCVPSDGDDGPKYPWGLRVDLDNTSLTKLGLGLMPVGTTMMLTAQVRVTSNSSNEREGSDPEQSMGLQIVSMDLGTPNVDRSAKTAKRLYPDAD